MAEDVSDEGADVIDADPDAPEEAADPTSEAADTTDDHAGPTFDWRGWALVGAIAVSFLLLPAVVLFLPAARGQIQSLGLTFRDAYLVLPLVPAFVLGAIAVWSGMRARQER